MPLPTLVTDKVVWYAYGDREQITELIQPIVGLAKKRSQGNGHVLAWHVEPIEQDQSEWLDANLMRPVPGPLFDQSIAMPLDIQHIAYRAPQWHSINQSWCVTKARKKDA
jgi:CRISPR type IV-associated protein Csf3